MEKRRVVITGIGAVTPLGNTAAESWQAVKDGVCGIAPITLYDHSNQKVSLAAEVKHFDPTHKPARLCFGGADLADGCKIEIMATGVRE